MKELDFMVAGHVIPSRLAKFIVWIFDDLHLNEQPRQLLHCIHRSCIPQYFDSPQSWLILNMYVVILVLRSLYAITLTLIALQNAEEAAGTHTPLPTPRAKSLA